MFSLLTKHTDSTYKDLNKCVQHIAECAILVKTYHSHFAKMISYDMFGIMLGGLGREFRTCVVVLSGDIWERFQTVLKHDVGGKNY